MDEIENTPVEEVAPQENEAQDVEAVTAEEVTSSPEQENETLILGKFKSQEELEKSYLELQRHTTKVQQSLKDPNYVYQLAKQAGLTDEQAEVQAQQEQPDINALVDQRLQVAKDYDKALQILPDLEKDPALETWARGLVDGGMTHQQAAQFTKDRLGKTQEVAKAEGAKLKEKEITAKEAAQTAPTIGVVEKDELTEINEKIASATGSDREKLIEQKIMLGMQ